MEASQCRSGMNLGIMHNAAETVGGKETICLHGLLCIKTGWSSLAYNRVFHPWLHPYARAKFQFVIENTRPFRQRASGHQGRPNLLRMDVTIEAGSLFSSNPRRKDKTLLFLTNINICVSSNPGNVARHAIKNLTDAVNRKNNRYWCSFPAMYPLLFLAMSTCREAGS